jgi:hypothetical protein
MHRSSANSIYVYNFRSSKYSRVLYGMQCMCSMGSVLMEYQDILDMKTTHAGPIPPKKIEVGEGKVIYVLSILKRLCHEIYFKLFYKND